MTSIFYNVLCLSIFGNIHMDSFYTMSVSFLPRPLFPILGFPGIFAVTAGGWHKHPLPRSWDNRQRDDLSMRSDAPGRSFLSRSLVYNV